MSEPSNVTVLDTGSDVAASLYHYASVVSQHLPRSSTYFDIRSLTAQMEAIQRSLETLHLQSRPPTRLGSEAVEAVRLRLGSLSLRSRSQSPSRAHNHSIVPNPNNSQSSTMTIVEPHHTDVDRMQADTPHGQQPVGLRSGSLPVLHHPQPTQSDFVPCIGVRNMVSSDFLAALRPMMNREWSLSYRWCVQPHR